MRYDTVMHERPTTRRHDLDWLRVAAFGMLILYHVGMFYVTWDWHVKSPHASRFLEPAMVLVNPWRLALLFFISGIALRFALDKATLASFAGNRFLRLVIPIAFGMLVLVTPQSYFELLYKGEIEPGFWRFYPDYLSLTQHFSIVTPTWNHLWYVVYLLVYTLIVATASPLLSRIADGPAARFFAWLGRGRIGLRLALVPAVPFILYRFCLSPHFPTTHGLVDDWANHANNLTVLLLGYMAAKSLHFWQSVATFRKRTLGTALELAVVLTIAYLNASWVRQNEGMLDAFFTLRIVYAWVVILALLGVAQRWFNRPGPVLTYLTGAVFPFYILHQTLIVVIGAALIPLTLPVAAEAAIVITGTILGCFAGYEIIRRIPPLRPLFGLPLRKRLDPRRERGAIAGPAE